MQRSLSCIGAGIVCLFLALLLYCCNDMCYSC